MPRSSIVEFVNRFFRGQHSVVDLYRLMLETQDPLVILIAQRLSYFQHIYRRSLLEVSIDNFSIFLHDVVQIRYSVSSVERAMSITRERLANYVMDDTMFLQSNSNRIILDDVVSVMFERGVALRTMSNIAAYDPLYRFFAFTTLLGDHVYHDDHVSRVDLALRYLLGNINIVIAEGYFNFNPWNYNSEVSEGMTSEQMTAMPHSQLDRSDSQVFADGNDSVQPIEVRDSVPLPRVLESYGDVGYAVNISFNNHRDRAYMPYNSTPYCPVVQQQVQQQVQNKSNESDDNFFKVDVESDQESVGCCCCNWLSS